MGIEDLIWLRRVVSSDSHAITYQSIGQYRGALLREIDKLIAAAVPVESLGREHAP